MSYLGNEEFDNLVKYLAVMYPNHDYESEDSKWRLKVKLLFKMLNERSVTKDEMKKIVKYFCETMTENYWQPAHFISLLKIVSPHRGING